jgi:hypothetical protein
MEKKITISSSAVAKPAVVNAGLPAVLRVFPLLGSNPWFTF